jgi:hypothetical protein
LVEARLELLQDVREFCGGGTSGGVALYRFFGDSRKTRATLADAAARVTTGRADARRGAAARAARKGEE